ncbi:hypothetical protein PPACK8108_LOCUS22294 [Phakopsora pachyrhizi]|uniref:T6SS Phospholipase effector Tle1-like catalytic domain-containing protein n=1 Tax=Phakopsora pachyrhizi TaxID=170000 RepID=A0AAV0BJV0_PHAPC|nr:hypothetical protein PPACK8108_LOCUS22294 [Phakopsora pachyrhizi]
MESLTLFGYSRGAFAAKILAGVITDVGILKVGHLRRFVDLFRAYRSLHTRFTSTNALGRARETLEQFRSGNLKDLMHKDVKIKCLGLFDTVSAIGAPLISTIDNYMGFDHFNLPNEVEHAFHCLALNETFPPFILEKWRITEKQAIERAELNRPIKQIWFPGVHGEIGGSKGSTKWSDVTLLWMLANIVQYGIFEFNKAYSQDIINRLIASRNERFSSLTRTNISRTVPTIFDKCTHEQYHKSLNDVANFQDIKANANRVQNLWAELLVEEEEVYPNNEMTTSTLPEHLN